MKCQKKRRIIKLKKNFVIVSLIAVIMVVGILAYLTDHDQKTNVFTIGNVKINLIESKWDADDDGVLDNDSDNNGVPDIAENITPGKTIEKDPVIQNIGSSSAYVYLEVKIPKAVVTTSEGTSNQELFTYTINSGWNEMSYVDDTDTYTSHYYYYQTDTNDANTAKLAPNANTNALFDSVTFVDATDVSNVTDDNLSIIINAFGIQTKNVNLLDNEWTRKFSQNSSSNNSVLAGKKLSILGDSISTYENISNDSSKGMEKNAVFYTSSNKGSFGIVDENDTYWMQIVNNYNMILNYNNSWSGSYATKTRPNVNASYDSDGSISNSMYRSDNLGSDNDIIAVFMGTNDLNNSSITSGTFNSDTFANSGTEVTDSSVFADAYYVMVKKLIANNSSAKIFLFTLMPNGTNNVGSTKLTSFNSIIRGVANYSDSDNIYLVDLYNEDGTTSMTTSNYTSYLGGDRLHPTATGMDYITSQFDKALKSVYGV